MDEHACLPTFAPSARRPSARRRHACSHAFICIWCCTPRMLAIPSSLPHRLRTGRVNSGRKGGREVACGREAEAPA
eukprot:10420920-Lingulodinium_polyedra.AAC.1